MVHISATGNTVHVNISTQLPLCLVPALKERINHTISMFNGDRISASSLEHMQREVKRSTEYFMANYTYHDGYPVLLNILNKLNIAL